MTKLDCVALFATIATLAVIPATSFAAETIQQTRTAADGAATDAAAAAAGKMLYGTDGKRIGAVYRVAANGDAQLIVNSRLVTVPAATLSLANGKLATSLTKSEITRR